MQGTPRDSTGPAAAPGSSGPAAAPGSSGPAATAGLPEPSSWLLVVVDLAQLTPGVRRLRCSLRPAEGGSRLFDYAPGQDLALTLPAPGGGSVKRRYTISGYDAGTGVVELDIVAHGDGPGARWLLGAAPGDEVEAFGPRGKITVVPGVSTQLFVGDEASLAAIAAMLRALAPGSRAVVVLDVAGEEEHRALAAAPSVELEAHWQDRGAAPPQAPGRVLAALREIAIVPGDSHAYVLGEFHVVSAARRLLAEQLDPGRISSKPYWRVGLANMGHGEPSRDE